MIDPKILKGINPTMHSVRMELFEVTPKEVWREYAENGYTWAEAINEELSYGESVRWHKLIPGELGGE
jgi:hypothetical protein